MKSSVRTKFTTKQLNQAGFIGSIIRLLFGIIVGILAIRFIFALVGANEANGLVAWIYQASLPLITPFAGIFGSDIAVATGRLELTTLLALVVYGVIGSLLSSLFSYGSGRRHPV